jgi:anti-sigma factor RsiW
MTSSADDPCHEWGLMLHGFVDGELDSAHSLKLEQHVFECPRCSAELTRIRNLKRTIAQEGVRWRMPEHVRAKILDAVAEQRGTAASTNWQGWLDWLRRWSLVPSLATLAASLALVLAVPRPGPSIQDELVASHVRSLLVDHLTDVPSSDRHTVKPWFNGKIDFSPPVVDLVGGGFPLIGGRLDYVSGKVVAALVYRRNGHVVNLFISTGPLPESTIVQDGYTIVRWSAGGLNYAAVSDIGPNELTTFRDLFMRES